MARTTHAYWAAAALLALGACAPSGNGGAASAANAPAASGPAAPAAVATTVPFIGCASDGQGGAVMAPTGSPKSVVMDPALAAKLAWYASKYSAALGPRGWYCFGTYGSDGAALYLAPSPIQSSDVLSDHWNAGGGPAIEVAQSTGDTSGRFTVAQAIARVFPAHMAFAQSVIAEGIDPPDQFPAGPFAADRTTPKSGAVVEYETPPNTPGLGTTFSRLTANASPIDGAAVLQGATPNLEFLAVRLPAELQGLTGAIVQQFETDAAGPAAPAAQSSAVAPSGPAPVSAGSADPVTVATSFYNALAAGDGARASSLMVPEKRSGNFSAEALSGFYGHMSQPLQLLSATSTEPTVVLVRYSFVTAQGHACNGSANLHFVGRNGQALIAGIEALNGC